MCLMKVFLVIIHLLVLAAKCDVPDDGAYLLVETNDYVAVVRGCKVIFQLSKWILIVTNQAVA